MDEAKILEALLAQGKNIDTWLGILAVAYWVDMTGTVRVEVR
jgi:hypothetical protein